MPSLSSINFVQFPDIRLRSTFVVTAIPRKKLAEKTSDGEGDDSERKTTRKRAPSRRIKKAESEVSAENPVLESSVSNTEEVTSSPESTEPQKPQRRTRKKGQSYGYKK